MYSLIGLISILMVSFNSYSDDYENDLRYENVIFLHKGEPIYNPLTEITSPQFHDLETAYKNKKYSNYSEFTDYLFSENKRLKDRFILIHHSESMQLSDFMFPRTIVYDRGTFYAFSDHPEQKNRRVEILETNPETFSMTPREIIFEDSKVTFRSNPQSCTVCHGSPARIIWNPYRNWPGAYGNGLVQSLENHSDIESHYVALSKSTSSYPGLKHLNLKNRPTSFLGFASTTAQLQYLSWISKNLTPENFSQADALPLISIINNCTGNLEAHETGIHYSTKHNPNVYNFGEKYLRAFFTPGELEQSNLRLAEWGTEIYNSNTHFISYLNNFTLDFGFNYSGAGGVDLFLNPAVQINSVLSRAGIDPRGLPASLFGNDYMITTVNSFAHTFNAALYYLRPDLYEGLKFGSYRFPAEYHAFTIFDCNQIQKLSLQAKRDENRQRSIPSFKKVNHSAPVLNRCAKCHVEKVTQMSKDAPLIPFNNSVKMARLLKDSELNLKDKIIERVLARGSKQMPPGKNPLSESEVAALKEYLESLQYE